MFLCHQNFVLQLYLYGCILAYISAQFVLRMTVLKMVGVTASMTIHLFSWELLHLLSSLINFKEINLLSAILLSFFDLRLRICFILACFSSLSIVSIVFTSSWRIYYSIQNPVNFYCTALNQFTVAVKNTLVFYGNHSEKFIEIFLIFYFS